MRVTGNLSSAASGLAVLLIFAAPLPAQARLVKAELDRVAVAPPPGARAPLDLTVTDAATEESRTLGAILAGQPALVLPVDYTCGNVCDPMIGQSGDALAATGLDPTQRRLILFGLDPKDDARTARGRVAALWGDRPGHPTILVAPAEAITRLTAALGYRFVYDAGSDSYAHPAAALLLAGDGRLSRVLSPLALGGRDLRLAFTEAGEGRVGTLADRLALLCYGFDAVQGLYTPLVGRILTIAGAATVAAIALLILALIRVRHRQERDARQSG